MNNIDQLESYSLDITPSRLYITSPYLALFKEELPSPSQNIYTWNHRVQIKAMHTSYFI